MTGTVKIARALWDDPTFRDSEMSQREAWIWLIAEASWKPRTKRIGTKEIKLVRAQLAASTRFLAAAWMWSEPKVRRYLDMLEERRMITRAIDAGITVVTICKYDDYQNKPRDDGALSTQQPKQDRRTTDANENKDEIRKETKEECAQPRETDFLILVRQAVGIGPSDVPRYWRGPSAETHVAKWLSWGLTEAEVLIEAKASQVKQTEPPDGPKALDRWMSQASKAKAAATVRAPEVYRTQATPKPIMTPEERLEFWAGKINGQQVVPPSAISSSMRNALVATGMVTEARLRERGL